jgi:hypothetical protein
LDPSFDIGSIPIVRIPAKPIPEFETSSASKGISYVVAVNSQRDVDVACQ